MMDAEFVADVARQAGRAILEVYETAFQVTEKEDRSPLTEADTRAHEIISRALRSEYPNIPVLSEEGKAIPYEERRKWSRFWLVDPLDGTKEFIKGNGEFTVNIALVENGTPLWGVIYIPVPDLLYIGKVGEGCREMAQGKERAVSVSPPPWQAPVKVVKSRSHPSPDLQRILDRLPSYEMLTRGSALKFCVVASGGAHFYPRMGPTWEWDTGAGHAIVSAAGGAVVDPHGNPFTYNKPELINGPFFVASDLEWLKRSGVLEAAAELL